MHFSQSLEFAAHSRLIAEGDTERGDTAAIFRKPHAYKASCHDPRKLIQTLQNDRSIRKNSHSHEQRPSFGRLGLRGRLR